MPSDGSSGPRQETAASDATPSQRRIGTRPGDPVDVHAVTAPAAEDRRHRHGCDPAPGLCRRDRPHRLACQLRAAPGSRGRASPRRDAAGARRARRPARPRGGWAGWRAPGTGLPFTTRAQRAALSASWTSEPAARPSPCRSSKPHPSGKHGPRPLQDRRRTRAPRRETASSPESPGPMAARARKLPCAQPNARPQENACHSGHSSLYGPGAAPFV